MRSVLFCAVSLLLNTACVASSDSGSPQRDPSVGQDQDTAAGQAPSHSDLDNTEASETEESSDTETIDTNTVDTETDDDAHVTYEDWCDRWKECGGTIYETAEDCVEATYDYFGTCPDMQAALDAYAQCMIDVSCDTFDPDTYNPADTPCAHEWDIILATSC